MLLKIYVFFLSEEYEFETTASENNSQALIFDPFSTEKNYELSVVSSPSPSSSPWRPFSRSW